MDVLILLMFIGVIFIGLTLGFFAWTVRAGSFQHADRLALLPLHGDAPVDARETDQGNKGP